MRVLVAGALQPFLAATEVPPDIEPEILPEGAGIAEDEVDGVVAHVALRLGAEEIERLTGLRVIANFGVGYDNIDMDAARARGIGVTNTPGVLTTATAELTWALILATARRLGEGERLVRAGEWTGWTPTQLLGMSLEGGTLGIVGAGRIGREVGRRAVAFGMRVVYWTRNRRPEFERETGARMVDFETLLDVSDVVSLHVPLATETRALIDARALERMKPGAILINSSRGSVVDEDALVEALESGTIRAAGLDVYADEPRVPERLRELDNVVLLPHLGSATEQARTAMWRLAWENVVRGVRGEKLVTPVE